MRVRWPSEIKLRARELRKQNLSFNTISRQLGVSKSTLHSWISDLKRPEYITREDKLRHLANIRPMAQQALIKQRVDRWTIISEKVNKALEGYPNDNAFLFRAMLSMLYWAEGSKGRGALTFANTDPELALLFITLLRKSYDLDESKLRVRLHLHYYHKIKETRRFWSQLLEIPEAKFGKIHIKERSKNKRFRKNFVGICFIVYHSDGLRYEVLETAKQLGKLVTYKHP